MAENGSGNQKLPNSLCRAGCGFYGSSSFDGMCSVCYKDAVKRKQQNPSPPPVSGRSTPSDIAVTSCSAQASSASSSNSSPVTTGSSAASSPGVDTVSTTPSVETATPTVATVPTPSDKEKEPTQEEGATGETATANANSDSKESPDKDKKPKKNRCHTCKKKVGLTGFECRCGGLYCSIHRYSDKHDCTFDYKEHGQKQIRKANPVIVGEKIQKI